MRPQALTRLALAGLALAAPLFSTGCQATVGGQTLPSAWYLDDDVQYFPAGPEFKLPNAEEVRTVPSAAARSGRRRTGWFLEPTAPIQFDLPLPRHDESCVRCLKGQRWGGRTPFVPAEFTVFMTQFESSGLRRESYARPLRGSQIVRANAVAPI